jgi:hypothetical protein
MKSSKRQHLVIFTIFFVSVLTSFAGKPLKVYILAGQSNMQGHAKASTFEPIGMDPKTAPILKKMTQKNGTPLVCKDVWISSIGNNEGEQEFHGQLTTGYGAKAGGPKIGPEFTFGIYMQKIVNEPILIIKTAWGGKSLYNDFRSPSAGPFGHTPATTGKYYRLMLDHINKVLKDIKRVYPRYNSRDSFELAGFVWFQGWNDIVNSKVYPNRSKPGGYDAYTSAMSHFIRDIRKDLSTPKMPFVIGVLGVGGPTSKYGSSQKRYKVMHQSFRDAMAAPAKMPEFKNNVRAVLTENYWDHELAALLERGGKVKEKSKTLNKDKNLSAKQRKAELEEFKANLYTARELKVLTGRSNAGYHYNGSGKIMAQIGKAFAEAIKEIK